MIEALNSIKEAIAKPFQPSRKVQIYSPNLDFTNIDTVEIRKVDASSDGRFSWTEAGKQFVKGFFSPITNMFKSPKDFLIGAGMIAAGIAVGVVAGPAVLVGAGLAIGACQLGYAGYKAATAKDGDGVEQAFYNAGQGTFTLGLSALAAKSVFGGKAATGGKAGTVANGNKALPPGTEPKVLPAPGSTEITVANTATGGGGAGGAGGAGASGASSGSSGSSGFNFHNFFSGAKTKASGWYNGAKAKTSGWYNGAKGKYSGWKANRSTGTGQTSGNRFSNWYKNWRANKSSSTGQTSGNRFGNWYKNWKAKHQRTAGGDRYTRTGGSKTNTRSHTQSNTGPKTGPKTATPPKTNAQMNTAEHIARMDKIPVKDVTHQGLGTTQVKNPYDVLNISRNASQAEIKAAFRQLASKLHTDTHNIPRNYFQDVQQSYEILNNPAKRAIVDGLF